MVSPPAVIPAQAGICPLRRDDCTSQTTRRHPGASRNLSFAARRLHQPNHPPSLRRKPESILYRETIAPAKPPVAIPAQAGIYPLRRDDCASQTTRRHPGANRNLPFAERRLHQPNHPPSSRRKPESALCGETIAPAKPPVVIPAQAGIRPLRRDDCTSQTTRRHSGASRNLSFTERQLHQPNHPSSFRRKPESNAFAAAFVRILLACPFQPP